MHDWQKRIILWLLASPFLLISGILKVIRHLRFLRLASATLVMCKACGAEISLLGQWKCTCGYVYRGHLMRKCPVCYSLPRLARCYRCGVTQLLRGR